jgi:hypothetical protein
MGDFDISLIRASRQRGFLFCKSRWPGRASVTILNFF